MVLERMCQPKENRAVSPVIGVILMVAITVILAAVIGAFVLEIGDQQETAPNTSFDTEQQDVFLDFQNGLNHTTVEYTLAGGGVLDRRQLNAKVNGNDSVYRLDSNANQNLPNPPGKMFPSVALTFADADVGGSYPVNDPGEEWESGERLSADLYAGDRGGHSYEALYSCMRANDQTRVQLSIWKENRYEDYEWARAVALGGTNSNCAADYDLLNQGDRVTLTWEASSGGKTQTLFRYTVQ
jgi:flagellin-like protein